MKIQIEEIEVEVTKKQVKNYSIHIKPPDAKVSITAPLNASEDRIKQIIIKKLNWIRKKQKQLQEILQKRHREFVTGETIYIWGKPYTLQVEPSQEKRSFVIDGEKAILTIGSDRTAERKDLYIQYVLSKDLIVELERLIPIWEQKTGLHCRKWRVNYLKGKWGVCRGRTKSITINTRLAYYPPECLEFIVVHELIHIKIPNHGKDFIACMDLYLPDWREILKKLENEYQKIF